MKVLSLFNGMSCGYLALQKLGIPVDAYYSSEVDKHAIKASNLIYPATIQLGDVTKWTEWDIDWSTIDILMGGSPCQGFSFAGKQLAFDDPRSKLFFVFVEIWEHIKKHNPKAKFLLENVKMKKEHEHLITRYMGVEPIEINSALLSAQNRVRLYWTNIYTQPQGLFGTPTCIIPQPKDKGILLRDILEADVADKYYLSDKMMLKLKSSPTQEGAFEISEQGHVVGKQLMKSHSLMARDYKVFGNQAMTGVIKIDKTGAPKANQDKASCFTAGGNSGGNHSDMDLICVSMIGRRIDENGVRKDNDKSIKAVQRLEPNLNGKTNCLTSVQKDNLVMQLNETQQANLKNGDEKANTFLSTRYKGSQANGMTLVVSEATKKGFTEIKPGECFDFENPKSETRRGRKMEDKSNCLMAKETYFMQYTSDYRIRRLTPLECGRLQTVPDEIIIMLQQNGISDTQIYRMCGNGWTIDVIAYILSFLKLENS